MCYDGDYEGDSESDFESDSETDFESESETDSEDSEGDSDNNFETGPEYDPDPDVDDIEASHEHDKGIEYDPDLERDIARETAYENVWDKNAEPDFDQIGKDERMEREVGNGENIEAGIEYEIAPKAETENVSSIDTSHKIDPEEDLPEYEITSWGKSEINSIENRAENEDELGDNPEIGIGESNEYKETWDPEEDEVGAAQKWDTENEAEEDSEANLVIDHEMNEEIDYEFKTDSDLEIDMDDLEAKGNSDKTEHEENSEIHRDSKIEFYESDSPVEYKEEEDDDDDEIKNIRKEDKL